MSLRAHLKTLKSSFARQRTSRRGGSVARLCLEPLEDRCLMAARVSFTDPASFDTGAIPPNEPLDVVLSPGPDGPFMAVAVGDFDRDGNADAVAANHNADTVSILLGDGAGKLGLKQTLPAGDRPRSVVVGDWNEDSKPDLAVVDVAFHVAILLGNGDGTFTNHSLVPAGIYQSTTDPSRSIQKATRNIASGDFNGDQHQDLAVNVFGLFRF